MSGFYWTPDTKVKRKKQQRRKKHLKILKKKMF